VLKNPNPPNWVKLRGLMIAKFGMVHDDEIIVKPKAICQRPCQHIATCMSQLEKYFHSGRIDEAKQ
jgi:hypothetical protein